jgi:hypothetical protein
VRPSFVVDVTGQNAQYVAQLVVNDGIADSKPATVTINTSNTPPLADAGNNQRVGVGALVQLDGSGSHDVDGDPITYRWALISKPSCSEATLSSTTAVRPTFVADWPCQEYSQDYVAQLIVNDGIADSEKPATVTITANYKKPVAAICGPIPRAPLGSTVTLDGSCSTTSYGTLTYRWSLTPPSGVTATLSDPAIVNPTFTVEWSDSAAKANACYLAQLIVNDGISDSKPATATVCTLYQPPVADLCCDQTVPLGTVVTLDASGSTSFNGHALTYRWCSVDPPDSISCSLETTTDPKKTFTASFDFCNGIRAYYEKVQVSDGISSAYSDTVTIEADPNGEVCLY